MRPQAILMGMILLAIAVASPAQTPAVGLRLGLNVANVHAEPATPATTYGTRTGLLLGGTVEMPFSDSSPFSVGLELMYAQKGSRPSVDTTGTIRISDAQDLTIKAHMDGILKVDELVAAPLLRARIPAGQTKIFVEFGPEFGFNMKHTSKGSIRIQPVGLTFPVAPITLDSTMDIADWKRNSFGLNFGLGLALPATHGEVIFDLRYNLGLTNMYTGSLEDVRVKTRSYYILAGYNFILKKNASPRPA
jgi:hypothetical protein